MEYKVGDQVLIREDLNTDLVVPFNVASDMVKWKNKVMTIDKVLSSSFLPTIYVMKEDNGKWNWSELMFDRIPSLVDQETSTEYIIFCGERIDIMRE